MMYSEVELTGLNEKLVLVAGFQRLLVLLT